jgi:SPP1 family predicted phage head-tail adaptor
VLSRPGASEAGRLKSRLVLEKPTRVPDEAGGATVTWAAAATLWAELIPLKAEERPRGEGLVDMMLWRIVVRYRGDVAPGDRFRLGARLFLVLAVSDPGQDGRWLACLGDEEGRA